MKEGKKIEKSTMHNKEIMGEREIKRSTLSTQTRVRRANLSPSCRGHHTRWLRDYKGTQHVEAARSSLIKVYTYGHSNKIGRAHV